MDNWMLIKLSCVGAVALASAIWILYIVFDKELNKLWQRIRDLAVKYNYVRK